MSQPPETTPIPTTPSAHEQVVTRRVRPEGPVLQGPARRFVRLASEPLGLAGLEDLPLPSLEGTSLAAGVGVPDGSLAGLALPDVLATLPRASALALLRAARRALAPDGTLRVTVPAEHPLAEDDALALRALADLAGLAVVGGLGEQRCDELVPAAGEGVALELARPCRLLPNEPLVSVIVEVVDVQAAVVSAASALRQGWRNVEVLLVGASDATAAACLALDDPRVRVAASTAALHQARGELALVLHPTEVLQPFALARLVACLQASPSAVMVAAWRPIVEADGTPRVTPRLSFDDVIADGVGVADLLLRTGADLIGGAATVMFRWSEARDQLANLQPRVLGGLVRTLGLLGRGDVVWLADPVATATSAVDVPATAARQELDDLRRLAMDLGLWIPSSAGPRAVRRLRTRPWWDAPTRASWLRTRVTLDAKEREQAWLQLAGRRLDESGPVTSAVEALCAAGRWPDAAQLAARALRERPDHAPLALAAAEALSRVGLADDARYLRDSALQDGVVVLDGEGRDPRRRRCAPAERHTVWVLAGDVAVGLRLEVVRRGAACATWVAIDGVPVGDLVFHHDGESLVLELDLDGGALGSLVTVGPVQDGVLDLRSAAVLHGARPQQR